VDIARSLRSRIASWTTVPIETGSCPRYLRIRTEFGPLFPESPLWSLRSQLSPSFLDPTNSSRLSPTARLTIGKRISDRAYLTFSRSLNTTFNDQIIQLEFDASDRLYWLISRNEDQQTYAIEFRVRHAF